MPEIRAVTGCVFIKDVDFYHCTMCQVFVSNSRITTRISDKKGLNS